MEAIGLSQIQDYENIVEELQQSSVQAKQAVARARTSAGESGVSGYSIDRVIGDLYRQEGAYAASLQTNFDRQFIQKEQSRKEANARAQSIINSTPEVQRPDYFGAALQIGQAYADYKTNKTEDKIKNA